MTVLVPVLMASICPGDRFEGQTEGISMRRLTAGTNLLFFGVALLFSIQGSVVWAEEGQSLEIPAVEERSSYYFEEATRAYEAGQYARAIELLELAWDYEEKIVYKYNQVLAKIELEAYDGALRILEAYGNRMRMDPRIRDLDQLEREIREEIQKARQGTAEELLVAEPPARNGNPLAIVLIAGGAVSLAGSGVLGTGILIDDTLERLENSRTDATMEEVYGNSRHNREEDLAQVQTHRGLAIATGVVGLALGTTGAVMLWRRSSPDQASTGQMNLSIEPEVSTTYSGARLRWSF